MREFMRQLVLAMQRLRPRPSVTFRVDGSAFTSGGTGRGTHTLFVGDRFLIVLAPGHEIEIKVASING